jgi:hypothetical protein
MATLPPRHLPLSGVQVPHCRVHGGLESNQPPPTLGQALFLLSYTPTCCSPYISLTPAHSSLSGAAGFDRAAPLAMGRVFPVDLAPAPFTLFSHPAAVVPDPHLEAALATVDPVPVPLPTTAGAPSFRPPPGPIPLRRCPLRGLSLLLGLGLPLGIPVPAEPEAGLALGPVPVERKSARIAQLLLSQTTPVPLVLRLGCHSIPLPYSPGGSRIPGFHPPFPGRAGPTSIAGRWQRCSGG